MPALELRAVSVRRGDKVVLDDVSFAAPSGSLVAVIGVSGAGKTALLRAIAGLDPLSAGSIILGGRNIAGLPPGDRGLAMTFQGPALMSTRNVARNIAFPLELAHATSQAITDRVGLEAHRLQIEGLLQRDVDTLSAGEAQMVQLARSLVRNPSLLLLDEPFAAISGDRATTLRQEVRLLQRRFEVTTVMTTSDPRDAMTADRIVMLERGTVVQVGTPAELYDRPDTHVAALLLGEAQVWAVEVDADAVGSWLVHPAFRIRAWEPGLRGQAGRRLQLVTRPEWWEIDPHGPVAAIVRGAAVAASGVQLTCVAAGHEIVVGVPGRMRPPDGVRIGDPIRLRLGHWVLLDPRDGRRIGTG